MMKSVHTPHFRSIQVTMAFAFSVLTVFTIIVTVLISYRLTEEVVTINSRQYTRQLVAQLAGTIETYIGYMESVSSFVLSNEEVQDYLSEDFPSSPAPKAEQEKKIRGIFNAVIQNRGDISLIALFGSRGKVVLHDPSLRLNPNSEPFNQAWFLAARNGGGKSVISASHVQNLIRDRYTWVISLSREIVDRRTGAGSAVLLVDLNFSVINDLCRNISLGKRGYIFIVDENGSIIYHPQQQLIYGNLKTESIREVLQSGDEFMTVHEEEVNKLYSIQTMKSTGWKVVGVNYLDELVSNRGNIRVIYTTWGLVFFGLTIILSTLLALRISQPIKRLRKSMKAVELGSFNVRADIESDDEIGELGKDFNIMVAKIEELIRQNTLHQELKRKSELKALQMQINPHFLYNTLDSVIWMAESKREDDVITMVSSLARLFRLSISKGKEIITIGEEVEHVTHYLTIQKMRYRDRLDFEIAVDPSVRRFRTVKIILQPLVENAIYHGIKNKAGAGKVTVAGRLTEAGIELVVSDDGVGMSPGTLENLVSTDDGEPRQGLGVRNVDERIKLYFGDSYGLSFTSAPDLGTEVRISLPRIEGESNP